MLCKLSSLYAGEQFIVITYSIEIVLKPYFFSTTIRPFLMEIGEIRDQLEEKYDNLENFLIKLSKRLEEFSKILSIDVIPNDDRQRIAICLLSLAKVMPNIYEEALESNKYIEYDNA